MKVPNQGERMTENFGGGQKGREKCCWVQKLDDL